MKIKKKLGTILTKDFIDLLMRMRNLQEKDQETELRLAWQEWQRGVGIFSTFGKLKVSHHDGMMSVIVSSGEEWTKVVTMSISEFLRWWDSQKSQIAA